MAAQSGQPFTVSHKPSAASERKIEKLERTVEALDSGAFELKGRTPLSLKRHLNRRIRALRNGERTIKARR